MYIALFENSNCMQEKTGLRLVSEQSEYGVFVCVLKLERKSGNIPCKKLHFTHTLFSHTLFFHGF
ncbi:hypothetical protein MAR_022102 [Mya arenaria]|uniref:Uncharacterized protein n=1 Tax=Mya arenaria TaxID=6604 RepID=A0ABY7DMH6_MYAAR|nr:hypothetical protein MAR_022102 [Mya arenaria]